MGGGGGGGGDTSRHLGQQPQEQRYPFLPVFAVLSCVQTIVRVPVFGSFNVHADADALRGCTNTVRESVLKVDSGRKSLVT